jgi:hypothetical protein
MAYVDVSAKSGKDEQRQPLNVEGRGEACSMYGSMMEEEVHT